ncbi:MAG TPA: hypothetical protein VGC07_00370 [Granulicella sp.]
MSKVLMYLLACMLPLAACAQQNSLARNSNLRSGPYTTSKRLKTLPAGTNITIISKYPRLGYVRVHEASADDTGWVLERNLAAVPSPEVVAEAAPLSPPEHLAADSSIYPDPQNTPGKPDPTVTQENIVKNICNKSWSTDSVRPSTSVTNRIKKQTMATYGFTDATNHYELDHLLSLQNGGCPDCVENLWPEAYGDSKHPMTQNQRAAWNKAHPGSTEVVPGSLEKDLVENHIHDEICFGIPNAKASGYAKKYPATVGVTLERGQQILATDWFACYQNIMDGNKPCQ